MKRTAAVALTLVAALASCAPRYNPQGAKLDADLTCSEIRSEVARAQSARTEAQKQKGLSGQNVAWALFFLPGIIGNEYNNSQVIKVADERIATLNSLYTRKGCTDTTP
ncbi:hypothetical protein [Deinococcus apachensis]|uniref:hypothetical protein n=1 Tax=Deinococcus apachensis TaxID=309886 RepID=UPI00036E9C0A|nr:hypothetical protein [Deinococcus apachensis]